MGRKFVDVKLTYTHKIYVGFDIKFSHVKHGINTVKASALFSSICFLELQMSN